MLRSSAHQPAHPSLDPLRPTSPPSPTEEVGLTSHGRRVRSRSPEPDQEPATFHLFNSLQPPAVLASPLDSPRLRERESEPLRHPLDTEPSHFRAPEGGPVRKTARKASSRVTLPPLTNPQQPPFGGAGLGFLFGAAPVRRSENKSGVSQASLPPPAGREAIASGVTFSVMPHELARLSASSSRPLVVRGSSSDGSLLVAYSDALAPQAADRSPPRAPAVPERDGKALAPALQAPVPQAEEREPAAPGRAEFDPVTSQVAKTLRSRLRKALGEGTDANAIYSDLLRPAAGSWAHLKERRLAFTPEFLAAVLLVLPTLANDDERTVLGQAVGALRVPAKTRRGRGTLGRAARSVIGEALAHEAVQARVPLEATMAFLKGANAGGARQWLGYDSNNRFNTDRNGEYGNPRNQFTASGAAHGIPQALARRLARQAQDSGPAQLEAVLAAATRLGSLLGDRSAKQGRETTLEAVTSTIDATSLPPATMTKLKEHFSAALRLPGAESGDELSDDAVS